MRPPAPPPPPPSPPPWVYKPPERPEPDESLLAELEGRWLGRGVLLLGIVMYSFVWLTWFLALCRATYAQRQPTTNPFAEMAALFTKYTGIDCACSAFCGAICCRGKKRAKDGSAPADAPAAPESMLELPHSRSELPHSFSSCLGESQSASGIDLEDGPPPALGAPTGTGRSSLEIIKTAGVKGVSAAGRTAQRVAKSANQGLRYIKRKAIKAEDFNDPVAEAAGVGYLVRSVGRRSAALWLMCMFNVLWLIPWSIKMIAKIGPLLVVCLAVAVFVATNSLANAADFIHYNIMNHYQTRLVLGPDGLVENIRDNGRTVDDAALAIARSPLLVTNNVDRDVADMLIASSKLLASARERDVAVAAMATNPQLANSIRLLNMEIADALQTLAGLGTPFCELIQQEGGAFDAALETCHSVANVGGQVTPMIIFAVDFVRSFPVGGMDSLGLDRGLNLAQDSLNRIGSTYGHFGSAAENALCGLESTLTGAAGSAAQVSGLCDSARQAVGTGGNVINSLNDLTNDVTNELTGKGGGGGTGKGGGGGGGDSYSYEEPSPVEEYGTSIGDAFNQLAGNLNGIADGILPTQLTNMLTSASNSGLSLDGLDMLVEVIRHGRNMCGETVQEFRDYFVGNGTTLFNTTQVNFCELLRRTIECNSDEIGFDYNECMLPVIEDTLIFLNPIIPRIDRSYARLRFVVLMAYDMLRYLVMQLVAYWPFAEEVQQRMLYEEGSDLDDAVSFNVWEIDWTQVNDADRAVSNWGTLSFEVKNLTADLNHSVRTVMISTFLLVIAALWIQWVWEGASLSILKRTLHFQATEGGRRDYTRHRQRALGANLKLKFKRRKAGDQQSFEEARGEEKGPAPAPSPAAAATKLTKRQSLSTNGARCGQSGRLVCRLLSCWPRV